ncbi:MAG: helix-turn-helix transcriptional regulator [Kofleriaceae bacterium]
MNDVIAANIRNRREHLAWTQEHLAEAAQLSVRTVQRAEEGRGMSAETLSAIAGALDVPIEELRHEPMQALADLLGVPLEKLTPELIASKVDEAKAKYATIPLTAVERSADLGPVMDADAFYFDCMPSADEVQDVAAELKQWIADLLDIRGDLSAVQEREQLKAVFEVVEQLRALDCCVSVGLHRHALRFESGEPMPWRTLYVIVAAQDQAKKFVMVERNAPVSFRL